MNTMNATVTDMIFVITVWVNVRAIAGRAATRTISHQIVKVGVGAMMDYIKGLDAECSSEVAPITTAELFAEYAELIRQAKTAGLIQRGCVSDHTSTYNIPEGATAASLSYKRLSVVCQNLMSACKARGRRAELESVHDRAKRISGFMSDLS